MDLGLKKQIVMDFFNSFLVCTADDQCGGNQVCDTASTKCKCADGHHESNGVCVKDGK